MIRICNAVLWQPRIPCCPGSQIVRDTNLRNCMGESFPDCSGSSGFSMCPGVIFPNRVNPLRFSEGGLGGVRPTSTLTLWHRLPVRLSNGWMLIRKRKWTLCGLFLAMTNRWIRWPITLELFRMKQTGDQKLMFVGHFLVVIWRVSEPFNVSSQSAENGVKDCLTLASRRYDVKSSNDHMTASTS